MRLISRGALLALGAVLAMSLAGVASASAAECPGTVEGGGIALCSEGHELHGTFAFSAKRVPGSAYLVPFGYSEDPYEVTCGSVNLSKGSFEALSGGKLNVAGLYIEYGGCAVPTPEHCEIANGKILVDGGEGTGSGPGLSAAVTSTSTLTLVGGGKKELWTDYVIRSFNGTCAGASENQVKGSAKCKLAESEREAVTHVFTCEAAELKDIGRARFSLMIEVQLASGKPWSLQKV